METNFQWNLEWLCAGAELLPKSRFATALIRKLVSRPQRKPFQVPKNETPRSTSVSCRRRDLVPCPDFGPSEQRSGKKFREEGKKCRRFQSGAGHSHPTGSENHESDRRSPIRWSGSPQNGGNSSSRTEGQ